MPWKIICFVVPVFAGLAIFNPAGPARAATVTVDGSFVFSATVVNSTVIQTESFEPFSGDPDALTSVILSIESHLLIEDNTSGEAGVGIVVDNSFFGQPVLFSNEQFFTTTFDLLVLGVEPSTFVGAPVGIDLTLFADEGGFTALWYAGTGVPFLDLPEYGSFSLTYETADPAVVPLPPAFALLLGSLAGFGALRRGCRKQSGAG